MQIFCVAFFGALGCLTRYGMSELIYRWLGDRFPYGILTINILGSFGIGFLAMVLMNRFPDQLIWRAALLIGFLGGFTTFSSFSYDLYQMLHQGAFAKAGLYAIGSVLLSLLATFMGVFLAELIG